MNFGPIISVKIKNYGSFHKLEHLNEDVIFERFANEVILTSHKSSISIEKDLLDAVCIGGKNDMGLDGICIKINGMLIASKEEAENILEQSGKAEIEFLFIQSKNKSKFDSGDFLKFTAGVKDFLQKTQNQPANEQVKDWIELKDYLLSDDVIQYWENNPSVRLYYIVANGEWNENGNPHIVAHSKQLQEDLKKMNTYGDFFIQYIDAQKLKRLCDDNENKYTAVVNFMESCAMPQVENVDNSCVILFDGEELSKLLITDDGLLRKGLFYDNVRDYQGDTTVNKGIFETVKNRPEKFILVNNGITIICTGFTIANKTIKIENPQVVNGCQTSTTIYNAKKNGCDVSKVVVFAKLISSKNPEIIDSVIKGTNRQNIVYEEAFECTSHFHKELEDFFKAKSEQDKTHRVYYERRSKQFSLNEINAFEKVSFRNLIQTFISLFISSPHKGHIHESKLILEFKNKIFIEHQSKYPYYIAGLLHSVFEKYVEKHIDQKKELKTYKFQILFLLENEIAGNPPDINKTKDIDSYCESLNRRIISNDFDEILSKSISKFQKLKNNWILKNGDNSRYQIKDNQDFTDFLLSSKVPFNSFERGTVVKVGIDIYGKRYGFISRFPRNIFFHSSDNLGLDFSNLDSKDVLYQVKSDTNRIKAVNVKLI